MSQSVISILITHRIQQALVKPFLGKPYIQYVHYPAIAGFILEVSSVLAARYRIDPVPFISVYVGNPDDAEELFDEFLEDWEVYKELVKNARSFVRLPMEDALSKVGEPDSAKFLRKAQGIRSTPENFYNGVMNYALMGLTLGFSDPSEVKRLYEGTHPVRESKLDGEDSLSYAEFENSMYEMLMEYCDETSSPFKSQLV